MATRKQTYIHTHTSSNAVMLVWGSLRLGPNKNCMIFMVASWSLKCRCAGLQVSEKLSFIAKRISMRL